MKDINKLLKLFEQYAHAKSYSTAFSELLDYFLFPFKWYANREQHEEALLVLSDHPKKDILVSMLTEIGELAEDFGDPLGALYELRISKGKNGQFFTPEPIAIFMASIVATDELHPGQTVLDPACGSGRMLLAAAKQNRYLRFYGADIDPLCAKMTLVNMVLNSLTGEIAHMNSLSNEFFRGYQTGTILKDGYHYPYYTEFTNPEESYIWWRQKEKAASKGFDEPFVPTKSPLMSEGVQGNLFEQF